MRRDLPASDAPSSSGTRRIGQISQNKRIQLPDDIALQAAMDLLVGHAVLRATIGATVIIFIILAGVKPLERRFISVK